MKLLLKIVLSIFILFIVISGGGMFFISRGLEAGAALEINTPDLNRLEDGIYTGEYKGGRWSNKVSVTVKEHRINGIQVTDDMMISKAEVTDELINRVLEKQSVAVDVVSGATVSSKAYLKSIENALSK